MNVLITIADITIRQDDQGRYCLNDLHKAAGALSKDQPSKWLILDSTKEFINAINNQNLVTESFQAVKKHQGGNGWQGTFVCREMVYAYAMWISPSFNLKVINTFDAVMTGQTEQPRIPQNFSEALRMAADEHDRRLLAEQQVQELAPKAQALERIARADGALNLTNAAKTLGIPPRSLIRWLSSYPGALIYRRPGGHSWIPYQDAIKKGWMDMKVFNYTRDDGTEGVREQAMITPKGLAHLSTIISTCTNNELPPGLAQA